MTKLLALLTLGAGFDVTMGILAMMDGNHAAVSGFAFSAACFAIAIAMASVILPRGL